MLSWVRRSVDAYRRYRTVPLSEIEYSLIQDILRNSPWYAAWLMFIFGIAFYALWGHVPVLWLMLFLTVFVIEVVVKIRISRHFERLPSEKQHRAAWRLVFDVGSAYSGLAYGLASLVIFHPMPDYNRFLLIGAFCALISNLSAATAFFTPISRTMLPCIAAPVVIALLLSGKPILALLALLIAVSLACTVFLSRLTQQRYRHISRLNQENRALVDSLSEQQRIAAEQQARAEQAVIEKSRFLATASHDLRQPLHALGLFHHALRMKSEDATNRELFESIDKSTDALNAMFDSLLDVSRLDANAVQPEFETVRLEDVCCLLEQEFSPVAREKGLYFQCIPLQVCLRTDSTLLARVLRNLISNAIKFTEEGGVTISAEKVQSEVRIMVSDTGPGIPIEEHRNVFSEFYQLESEDRFGTVGVGLGLSIVRRLCELLNIDVSLDVGESAGTLVTLRMACLPTTELPGEAAMSEAADSLNEAPQDTPMNGHSNGAVSLSTLKGRCILFIDDDPETRQAMGDMLTQWGCLALCESDEQGALDRIDSLEILPDMLICDFQLANGESGVDVIRHLRDELAFELPAILVSGASGVEETRLIRESGFECLTKPVSAETLKQVIQSMIAESTWQALEAETVAAEARENDRS